MPATDEEWARSYAIQALSDLDAREKLADANAKKCHRLHFLQMAAEKTCKAHLTWENGHDTVRKSHAYVARVFPIIARVFYPRINDNNQINQWELSAITRFAREIELLALACDDGDLRRDNSEYPWEDARGDICTPCEYNFPNIDDGSRTIIRMIRLIRTAAESYSRPQLTTNH
jgi:hypothetical protein